MKLVPVRITDGHASQAPQILVWEFLHPNTPSRQLVESGDDVPITRPEAFQADYEPSFSRDGRMVACIRRRRGAHQSGPYSTLLVVDVAAGAVRNLTIDDALALSPALP